MAAFIDKNELTAAKRRCDVQVASTVDGSWIPPGTSLTGKVFISQSSSDYIAATGTLTQKKRAVASGTSLEIEATDTTANTVTVSDHGMRTGSGPWLPDTTGGGLDDATDVYLIVVDEDTLAFATSEANAYAGTKVDLSADVTDVEIVADATTREPIPGHYVYEWTQTETNFDGSEGAVLVDYAQPNSESHGWYGYTTVTFKVLPKGFDDAAEDDGTTYGDYQRALGRGETCLYDEDEDGNFVHYKPDGSTPSHGGQVTSAGRISTTTPDFTP